MKNAFCSYCGNKFVGSSWPRTCTDCNNISYINPLPVVVLLVPIGMSGLLVVRRNNEPARGQLALPGGYIDVGETWQEGAVRELKEETGIVLEASDIHLQDVMTSLKYSNLLVFGGVKLDKVQEKDLTHFTPNDEVSELMIITEPIELAFPTHTKCVQNYFASLGEVLPWLT